MEMDKLKAADPRILILSARRRFIGSHYGMGYQLPLGLASIGGPLKAAGVDVRFLDADARGMSDHQIIDDMKSDKRNILMIGHNGSTGAYPAVIETCRAIKREAPNMLIIYGGVFPTFAYHRIMEQVSEIDIIVRGEGEETTLELAKALRDNRDISGLAGLVLRDGDNIIVNKQREPIADLDIYNPGWELVDWSLYDLFGSRPAGQIQFGRGCIYKCSFCGQWGFWRRYRHRSPVNFVDNLEILRNKYSVTEISPADEHFVAKREVTEILLKELINRRLGVHLYVNLTVKDILRDRDILSLYREAGIVFAAVGVESDDSSVQQKINKGNAFEDSVEAVGLLRKNKIMPLIQMIYGLEDETYRSVIRKYRSIKKIDPDFANLEYITPHFWTSMGRAIDVDNIIQIDQSKWDYRNQIVKVETMSEQALFWSVKITEMLIHLRPKVILRAIFSRKRYRRAFRIRGLTKAFQVWVMEILEFSFRTDFILPGEAKKKSDFVSLALGKKVDSRFEGEVIYKKRGHLRRLGVFVSKINLLKRVLAG